MTDSDHQPTSNRSPFSTLTPVVASSVFAVVLAAALWWPVPVGSGDTDLQPGELAAADGDTAVGAAWTRADDSMLAMFLADWEQSLTGRYAVAAIVHRTPLSEAESSYGAGVGDSVTSATTATAAAEPAATSMIVYHAQLDAHHRLQQLGGTATVVDPINGVRSCRRIEDQFWCSDGSGPSGVDEQFAAGIAGVGQAVSGENPSHRLYQMTSGDLAETLSADVAVDSLLALDLELRCWDLRSLSGDTGHEWGRRSTFCFDRATGAKVFARTVGQFRVETLVAASVKSDVTAGDLDPQ